MSQLALILETGPPSPVHTLRTRPIPLPGLGEVQIKIYSTAVNPVDYKVHDSGRFIKKLPVILGTDGAGTVTALGPGATRFHVGDRVIWHGQFAWQGDESGGDKATFQEVGLAEERYACKIPDAMSFDEASTIPVGATTAASGLYFESTIGLTAPWEKGGRGKYAGESVVVLGGSSSVGNYTVQFAALSGFSTIITTSSPSHFSLLRSLGATHTLPRTSASLATEILDLLPPGGASYVIDAISLPDTQLLAVELTRQGGKVVRVLAGNEAALEKAKAKNVEVVGAHGASHLYPEFFTAFWSALGGYLAEGSIKPNPAKVIPGGLRGWEEAFELHRKGRVSGVKLVLRPGDTDGGDVEGV